MWDCEINVGGTAVAWPTPIMAVGAVFTQACNIIASVGCVYVIASILRDKEIRKNTLNLYVIFMLFPDAVLAFITFLVGVFRIRNCGDVPTILIVVLDFCTFFYYMCNFSLNSVVAWELYSLLEQSRRISRAGPPPMKRTLLSVFCAYSFALIFATSGIVDTSWSWWWREKNMFGSPQPGGLFTEMAAICLVGGLVIGFIIFVIAIRIHICRKKLMPKKGRTKMLSNFFQRIILVFLVFYVPTITLHVVISSVGGKIRSPKRFWMEQAIHFLTALQPLVTLAVVSQKPDIKESVFFFRQRHKPTRRESFIVDRSSTVMLYNSGRSSFFNKAGLSIFSSDYISNKSMFFQNSRKNLSILDHASAVVATGDDDNAERNTREQTRSSAGFTEPKETSTRDQTIETMPDRSIRPGTDDFSLRNQGKQSKHGFDNELEKSLQLFCEWEMEDVYEMYETDDSDEEKEKAEETTFEADELVKETPEIICANEVTQEAGDVCNARESSIAIDDVEDIYTADKDTGRANDVTVDVETGTSKQSIKE